METHLFVHKVFISASLSLAPATAVIVNVYEASNRAGRTQNNIQPENTFKAIKNNLAELCFRLFCVFTEISP